MEKQSEASNVADQFDDEFMPLVDEVAALIRRYEDEYGIDFKNDVLETIRECA
jgi:transcriptional antiterminator